MMTARNVTILVLTISLIGLMFALMWSQTGLPAPSRFSPWDPQITLYPSLYAVWLPALYLFFSGLWLFLLGKFPDNRHIRAYWRYDCFSYAAVLVIFLLQANWQAFGDPKIWLRGALLLLVCAKSAFVLRMLYQEAELTRPAVIGMIGIAVHLLLLPFHYQAFALQFTAFFQQPELTHLAVLGLKIIGVNIMTVEMFRLSGLLARSPQSAVFSWFVVTFTFPVLSYPKISHILAGLFLIFILRLIFSRLDTRELMLGLFHGPNAMILLKFAIVLMLMIAAGFIFWSNVKPGLGFHGSRAIQAVVLTLFDAQGGLLCYAPLYWLTIFGMVYVVFFRVWDGVLLLITGGLAYVGYHFLAYGILDRIIDPTVTVPFLPILGIFIAIAHSRFGKMRVFRYLLRLGTLVTVVLTVLFLVLFPDFQQIQVKFSEIQRTMLLSAGIELASFFPSSTFRPFSLKTFLWLGTSLIASCFFCMARTRYGYWIIREKRHHARPLPEVTFAPLVVLTCILLGSGGSFHHRQQSELPLSAPLVISSLHPEAATLLEQPVSARRLRIIGNLSAGAALTHNARIVNITIFDKNQRFETFTLRAGKDIADEMLEHPAIRPTIAHGRAALYQSRIRDAGNGITFAAHDYYTELTLPRRLDVQKIVFKFADPAPNDHFSQIAVNFKAMVLIE